MGTESSVGFHAAYDLSDGVAAVSSVGNALVGSYLDRLGLSYSAIEYISAAQPQEIQWLTFADAQRLGIAVTKITAAAAPTPRSGPASSSPVEPHPPVATPQEEPIDPTAAASSGPAVSGTVTWSFVPNSPDGPEVVGTASIPDRKLTVTVIVLRNGVPALAASHLIEVTISGPSDSSGGVKTVPSIAFKLAHDDVGAALAGIAGTVKPGLYWIALSNSESSVATNISMMQSRGWIDLDLVYQTGQRAILTLEEGPSGSMAFNQALTAWQTLATAH